MDRYDIDGVARVARLMADPLRAQILTEIAKRPMTVNEIVDRVGALQPRVSSHLGILREAGWLQATTDGTLRRYRIANSEVVRALAILGSLSRSPGKMPRPGHHRKRPRVAPALRESRTCYGHLAGRIGVSVLDALLERSWVTPRPNTIGKLQPAFDVTSLGTTELERRHVSIPPINGRRQLAYACPDWTEPGVHLGGALGKAILNALSDAHVIQHITDSRAVTMHEDRLREWLGEIDRLSAVAN